MSYLNLRIFGCIPLCLLVTLFGCATAPSNPALLDSDLPRQVPVRQFVANTSYNDNYRLSPDGSKMAYQGVSMLRPSILWRNLSDDSKNTAVRFRKGPPNPRWSADSRYILYGNDPTGREQVHLFSIDTEDESAKPRDLTPYEGVTAFVNHIPNDASSRIYVSHNRRDPAIFDIYEIDLQSGKETLMFENSNNVIGTLMDDEGNVRVRVRQTEDSRLLEVPDGDAWRIVLEAGQFDWVAPLSLNQDSTGLYLISNVNRDKAALLLLELGNGTQTLVYEHPDVDVQDVLMSEKTRRPLAVFMQPDFPAIAFLDAALQERITPFFKPGKNGVNIMSIDRAERHATLVIYDHTGASFQLVDLQTGRAQLLGESAVRKNADVWVEKTPFSFIARDGMQLNGYLSKPKINTDEPLPTVLLVHGGPWARDGWGFSQEVQFLANRGYAVLQVNYRGSSGFGKDYLFAGEGEFAGKMHTDLIDAVDWSIEQGTTDADKVAIIGGSYGGYATLVGMTMTPDRFQCGVDYVGVSDLTILTETAPPYWKPSLPLWYRFIGDASDPDQRKILASKSPVNFARNVQKPILILHGANDPRVVREHSDRMVDALKAADKEVEYIVIDDEGHGFDHWKHEMTRYRKTEDFLASCLGGRSGGLDFFQLGSWAF